MQTLAGSYSDVSPWQRSTFCATGECVEVCRTRAGHIGIRHGGFPEEGVIEVSCAEFGVLLDNIKSGSVDWVATIRP